MGERGEISRRARFLAVEYACPGSACPGCGPSDHERPGLPARLKRQPHFKSSSATSSRSLPPHARNVTRRWPSTVLRRRQRAACVVPHLQAHLGRYSCCCWDLGPRTGAKKRCIYQTKPDIVDADALSRSLSLSWSSFSRMQAQFDSSIDRGSKRWMRVLGAGLLFAGVWYGFVTSYAIPPHRKPKH